MFRFFENLVDPFTDYPETDSPPTRLFPFLWDYSQPFKRVFLYTALMSVVVAAVEIWLIHYMGRLVDLLSGAEPAQVMADHGLELLAVAVFILLIRPMIQWLDVALLNNGIIVNFGTLIRWRAHRHVLRQSVGWFENDFAGRLANRIMQTPPAAGDAIFQVFDAITYSLAYLVGAALLLWGSDIRLVLPLLVWFALYALLVRWTMKRVGPASKASSDARSMTTGRVVDSYSNIHSVKLFAHHEREIAYAREAIEHTRRTFAAEMRIYTLMDVMLTLLNGLLIVAVVGWAIWLWVQGLASVGVVAAATALTLRLNGMTGWIMWALSTFFRSLGVVSEGMETIAQPIDLRDATGAKAAAVRARGDPGRPCQPPLRARQRRLAGYQPDHQTGRKGRGDRPVRCGEIDLREAASALLRPRTGPRPDRRAGHRPRHAGQPAPPDRHGAAGQFALHRSVRDNILYGRPDATEDEMIAAAKRAEAHDFILDLSDPQGSRGYDAHVGERGVKLSGGQRQRITIARVILKDAPILVLDEATSALDSEVESLIQNTLYGVMEGKTVIAIAHRLSTIAHMDRIIVLDDGRIAEEGTHEALLARGGLYAGFWARQSGGFIGTDEAAE